jgi:hypothetical protein
MKPEVLYKRASLVQDLTTDEIKLKSVYWNGVTVPLNSDAKCLDLFAGLHGQAPARFCSCGFHAYKEYNDAHLHPQAGDVVLRVVGSGKMFEYNKGYRYGHQRLEEIIVYQCVSYNCSEPADRLAKINYELIRPVCRLHSGETETQTIMSFSEFEEVASASLPADAPRVTIRSEYKTLVPWDRSVANRTLKKIQYSNKVNPVIDGVTFGLVAVAAAVVIRSAREILSS